MKDSESEKHTDKYRAPALDKGLDILEILAEQPYGLTRTELVKAMDRAPSEIYRMLERLVIRGYVTRSYNGDRYALSFKLFTLAHRHPPFRRLIAEAQPLMDALTHKTQQSCHLVVPEQGVGLVLTQSSPVDNWEFRIRPGARLDLPETSSGMTLLAFQHREQLNETLAIWGVNTTPEEVAKLQNDLELIRRSGYRIKPSRQLAGVTDLSVPILNDKQEAIAVLTCPYISRLDNKNTVTTEDTLSLMQTLCASLSV